MPRIARMLIPDTKTAYHVMSRTALDGFPFGPVEKDKLVNIIKRFSKLYFTETIGFCIMDNHWHLLTIIHPERNYSDEDIKKRFIEFHGKETCFPPEQIPYFRKKWSNLSEFIREIKQTFSRYYNRLHKRRGTLWGERFKSVIVENGAGLLNCLAYIDLNPIRAGIIKKPDDYRWSSIGYHAQTDNADGFLSWNFGLAGSVQRDKKERLRQYREYLYEAGAIERSDGKSSIVIDKKIIKNERNKNFEITSSERFVNKTRYFTDSGIIGSKEFVAENYQRFKHMFLSKSKNERKPKPVKGINGLYSLKRLSG